MSWLPLITTLKKAAGQSPSSREAASVRWPLANSPILRLQRLLGNQRVAQLIQAKRLTPEGRILDGGMIGRGLDHIQPKLTVGAADDQYEQEADGLPAR